MFSVQFKHAGQWVTVEQPFQSRDSAELFTVFMLSEYRIVPFCEVCPHPRFENGKCEDCGEKCKHEGDFENNECIDCGEVMSDFEPDYMDIAHRHAEDKL